MTRSPERRPLVAGNWKMNTTAAEAAVLVGQLRRLLAPSCAAEVVLLPPFTSLAAAAAAMDQDPRMLLGAQDCYWKEEGAYTGEISLGMLAPTCAYVLAGHSERRQLFGETDKEVAHKVAAIVAAGLTPILAVGETLDERSAGKALEVIRRQTRAGLGELEASSIADCVVAYEPIWSIGSGKTATPADADAAASAIRAVADQLAPGSALTLRVLYGGSVTAASAAEMFALQSVDGGLIGGASLRPEEFCQIVSAASAQN